MKPDLEQEKIAIIKHALGIGSNHPQRNSYYVNEPDNALIELLHAGYMEMTKQPFWGGAYYRVTETGILYIKSKGVWHKNG